MNMSLFRLRVKEFEIVLTWLRCSSLVQKGILMLRLIQCIVPLSTSLWIIFAPQRGVKVVVKISLIIVRVKTSRSICQKYT